MKRMASKLDAICFGIMVIIAVAYSFAAGKCFSKGEMLKAIYFSIWAIGLLILMQIYHF